MLQSVACLLTTWYLTTYVSTANAATTYPPGVIATGTMGPTNPPEPTLGTSINQTSMARLVSINSIDVSGIALLLFDQRSESLQDFLRTSQPYGYR
jgi:hypothetical protein